MSESDPSPRESQAVVGAFLMRYLEDRENGAVQPLEAYQAAYKGYEELIAREYARLGRSETITEGGLRATRPVTLDAPHEPGPGKNAASTGLIDAADEVEGYRLVRVLGQGGMGTVYLARQDRPIERDVALKVIKLGMDTREVVARFDMERQALALMDHPNIATVHDAGQTRSGRPFFAMEHFEGTPITDFCDAARLDVQGRIQLMIDACDAVQHAHQKGVIHRDLKPSNILVALRGGKPTAKIIDFGIAKSTREPLTERTLETQLGQLIGTPAYMSPEQAQFDGLDIDTRVDIYALGMILYELLVGALPFEPRSARDLPSFIRQILDTEPARPSTRLTRLGDRLDAVTSARRTDLRALAGRLRGDLDWITMKAIEKDRERRYGSASELADDLRRHLAHEPVLARAPTLSYRTSKFLRRRRRSLTVSAVVVVLLIGSAFAAHSASEAQARRERIERSRVALAEAEAALDLHGQLKASLEDLERKWRGFHASHKTWEPPWDRRDEIEAWRAWRQATDDATFHFGDALLKCSRAGELALPGSDEMKRVNELQGEIYLKQLKASIGGTGVSLDATYFERLIQELDDDLYRREFADRGRIALVSDPAEAEVFLFRYEFHEGHLLPLPYAPPPSGSEPRDGLVGEPFLEVEAVARRDLDSQPFRPRDRLLEVDGQSVRVRGSLVERLKDVAAGEIVTVKLRRDGEVVEGAWVPFPLEDDKARPDLAGRIGLRFAGYPLDFRQECRLGITASEAPLSTTLPEGSYLLVFRKEGFRDTRFPVAVPRRERGGETTVRLLRESDIPPGFVYVPAGPVAFGGDAQEADQSLEPGLAHVDGFFMGRLEVTLEEYLEFLNAPENLERIDGQGIARPLVDWDAVRIGDRPLIEFLDSDVRRSMNVHLVPEERGKRLLELEEGRWTSKAHGLHLDWPVLGVNRLAALEYALWVSTSRYEGRWTFRLPTDLEWEKAARGVDRRVFVWGDYGIYSFCRSFQGNPRRSQQNSPATAGSYPLDESVFGVRDLAGSAGEPTANAVFERLLSYRGGDWYHLEESSIRIANRNGWPAHESWISNGIRLVASVE